MPALAAPEPYVDPRSQEEQYAAYADEFTWGEADTVADALAALDDVSAAVLDAVQTIDPDRAGARSRTPRGTRRTSRPGRFAGCGST